jgi:3-hydroxyisobutyrate dehydrogenase-like beta-hydroxyacid dehydrogenase
MPRVGFVGVGHMGHGMARNLLEKGYPLTIVAHRNRVPVDDLVGRGATEAASLRDLAAVSDIVVLCVTGSAQVEAVLRGEQGLAAALAPGSIVVDCSTSDPGSTAVLAAELAAAGIRYADAPLGRTPADAEAGNLDVMVGAEHDVLERIRPVLEAFAGKVVHVGGIGDGHRVKLLNNFLSLGYAALFAEVFALARKVGIAPEDLDRVISGGRLDSGFYQTFSGWIIDGDPESHRFTMVNALKDLTYVDAMATAAGLVNPVGAAARNSFAAAVAAGEGESYIPLLTDVVARINGLPGSRSEA